MRKFWMVIGENSLQTSKRHYNYPEAFNEVERLARQERKTFFLLEAVEYCKFPVEWLGIWEEWD